MPPLYNLDNFFHNPENVFGNIWSLNMIGLSKTIFQDMSGLTEITDPGDWPL